MGLIALIPLFVVIVFVAVSVFVKRYRESDRPHPSWTATNERFKDPSTGRLMRVWTDPEGERHYVPEGGS